MGVPSVIGKTFPFGKGFLGLVNYLEAGAAGEERERLAWVEFRNLPTKHPDAGARLMAATAKESLLTQRPVYHLVISFDPGDPVDRETMTRVADAVVRKLGLSGHQAMYFAHDDTRHPHVHLVVNRVHPVDLKAWEKGWDWPRIEQELREQEVELGLRRVPGKFGRVPGRERAPALVRGDAAFLHRVNNEAAPVLERAQSWADVDRGLTAVGLAVRVKGGGFTIHDGEQEVKASDVGRGFSRSNMEKRLGKLSAHRLAHGDGPALAPTPAPEPPPARTPEPERSPTRRPARPPAPVPPPDEAFRALLEAERLRVQESALRVTVRRAADLIRAAGNVSETIRAHADAVGDHHEARAEVKRLEGLDTQADGDALALRLKLDSVFTNPADAADKLHTYGLEHGPEATCRALKATPEEFGTLRRVNVWWTAWIMWTNQPARDELPNLLEPLKAAIRSARARPQASEIDAANDAVREASAAEVAALQKRDALPDSTTHQREAADALGALLREGVPEWWIRQELGRLLPPGDYEAEQLAERVLRRATTHSRGPERERGLDFF